MTNAEQTARAPKLTRRALERLEKVSLHDARNWSKAEVFLAEWPPHSGQQVVIKDLKPRALWFRVLAGRYFLRREWNALRALRGVAGVPQPVARPDADCIVMEYRDGTPLSRWRDGTLPLQVLARLETLIETLHARGVIHGDLHQDNILLESDGTVALIDWATAGVFGKKARRNAAKKLAFEEWCALDNRAVAKIKVLHAPQMVSPAEQDLLLNGGSRVYRVVKKVRRAADKLRGKKSGERAAVLAKYIEQLQRADGNTPRKIVEENANCVDKLGE